MDILRFTTAGNVDDGKSTLIGRLLLDTHNIKTDILSSVSDNYDVNLAYITDGLRNERQLGITIDVSYKYFVTSKRKYIITDAPGHFEYTRNLITGASTVDLIIILVDALNGITDQTKRHAKVAEFLGIPNIIVAINKMDAINYSQTHFQLLHNDLVALFARLGCASPNFIPISALKGDNICSSSSSMSWYQGQTLLEMLENVYPIINSRQIPAISIQYQCKDAPSLYAAKVVSGSFKREEAITLLPQKKSITFDKIYVGMEEVDVVVQSDNILVSYTGEETLDRGNICTKTNTPIVLSDKILAKLFWMDQNKPLEPSCKYYCVIGHQRSLAVVTKLLSQTDLMSLEETSPNNEILCNEFATIELVSETLMVGTQFQQNSYLGRGVLIDMSTNNTVGAFTIITIHEQSH